MHAAYNTKAVDVIMRLLSLGGSRGTYLSS